MKFIITLFFVIVGLSNSQLNAQTFEWAKAFGGANLDAGNAIAVDGAGNVYTTGRFLGPADFDPGPGVETLTSLGVIDAFIQKLDANGDLVWAKRIGGTDEAEGLDITIDISGNIYITGYFRETVDFDPGTGLFELTSQGSDDIFILKLNNNGDFLWAKSIGGTISDLGASISTDAFGNVYSAGFFRLTADFDPGSGTFNLTSQGGRDGYVLKLDAGGNFLWAKQLGGSSVDEVTSMVVDGAGNVFSLGTFGSTADFDPGPGTFNLISEGSPDIFVSKLDFSGNFVWAKQLEGGSVKFPTAIDIDLGGNVYTTGHFLDTVDIDPGAGTNEFIANVYDVFVAKLDATGNLAWAQQIGGDNIDYCHDLVVDNNQNVFLTGEFRETTDFDPGSGIDELTAEGSMSDIYVQKLDASGNHVWVQKMGGVSNDMGFGIDVRSDYVYTTGQFQLDADFDPGVSVFNLTSAGAYDVFVHKIGESTSSILEFENQEVITISPNPNNGLFHISFEKPTESVALTLTNLQGKVLYSKQLDIAIKEQLEISTAPGIYLLQVSTPKGKSVFQIVKE